MYVWNSSLGTEVHNNNSVSVSPCDLWIVFAAAGRNAGNCFLTTCAVLFLPTAN